MTRLVRERALVLPSDYMERDPKEEFLLQHRFCVILVHELGCKKVVCCSRNMCASGKGIDALSAFFLSLTLNAESPGLLARIETVFPCFPTASAVAVTTSFFFLSLSLFGNMNVSQPVTA